MTKYTYPFGQALKKVEQADQNPKKVFVLGVYASAVHARWLDKDGKEKIKAFAVASEPEIFWKGDRVEEIIDQIKVPEGVGKLVPAASNLNGPSGIALDELFLKPLGFSREDAWLSDLLPYTRINPSQEKAIKERYNPLVQEFGLSECTIPNFKKSELKSAERVKEIEVELLKSQADAIITLGDLPLQHFTSFYDIQKRKKLSKYVVDDSDYGKYFSITIGGKELKHLPLVHPRQAGRLGTSSSKWFELHDNWVNEQETK